MPQHPNTTRKQTQAKNKKSQKTKFLAFLAIYERCAMFIEKFGAGKRSRTVDLNLGKVALYQLSYSRKQPAAIKQALVLVFHNYKIAKTATITFFSI